ncbi:MAG: hypothetical protein Q8Q08_06830 [Candidatus Omnitrophota bacterium]|nr:hypothetical protein [Candidatus Omnitrophota bacterium]
MVFLVKFVGLLIMSFGFAIFASPPFAQKMFDFFKVGKRIYWAGVVRTSVGLLMLLTSSRSLVPLAAIALGLMFLVSGIVVFAADIEKLKDFMLAYRKMPALVIRLMGLAAASFGILVFSIF